MSETPTCPTKSQTKNPGPFSLVVLLVAVTAGMYGCSGSARHKTSPDNGKTENGGLNKADATVRFREVAKDAGVNFTYRDGGEADKCTILETLGGGVAMFDFDGDHLLDLCFPGGGKFPGDRSIEGLPTGLFRNLGDMQFQPVAELAGIQSSPRYSHGIAVGDYDSDGFRDVLITSYGGVQLWRNQGDGTFMEVQDQAGLDDTSWSSSAAWGDLNGDGLLDLYIVHYVNWSWDNDPHCPGPKENQREICSPRDFKPLSDVVYYNNGDGTFRNSTSESLLRHNADKNKEDHGKGLGVLLCDVDNDGDLDIYVANDTTNNFLYINDGSGRLHEMGELQGVAVDGGGMANGSMGLDLCDYNRDGWPDLWVANFQRESFALYRNDGPSGFYYASHQTGISTLESMYVGFGTAAIDLDRDSDEDLVVANGHILKYPLVAPRRQLPLVLLNDNARFRRVTFSDKSYFGTPQLGRGLAAGDLDEDGDLDLVVSHVNDPVAVLLNETPAAGDWLSVTLIGVTSNRDAVGARLVLETNSGQFVRQVKGGGSYMSHNDRRVFWGIANGESIKRLTIHWPSGKKQELSPVNANQSLTVIEPQLDTKTK